MEHDKHKHIVCQLYSIYCMFAFVVEGFGVYVSVHLKVTVCFIPPALYGCETRYLNRNDYLCWSSYSFRRGEAKGGSRGLSPPTIKISPPKHDGRTVNTKYCPHTSCTNIVINVIYDGLRLIVIAVNFCLQKAL